MRYNLSLGRLGPKELLAHRELEFLSAAGRRAPRRDVIQRWGELTQNLREALRARPASPWPRLDFVRTEDSGERGKGSRSETLDIRQPPWYRRPTRGRGGFVGNAPTQTSDPRQAVNRRDRRSRVEDDLVSGAEIGRRLGVSRERVRQWASNPKYGFPPSLGRVGVAKVWRWETIAEWAEARETKNRGPGGGS